ncbi:MAG: Nif3-like dinuclear metal center hexameric protein [Planctomycetes bacterium]|nr:Nif3-like dinuclear metal center hexameric protein [Planctomycetota bacterium]
MNHRLSNLLSCLAEFAPPHLAEEWDNTGLQIGDPDAEITGVHCALDADPALLAEARAAGANAVVTHHPLLFRPLKRVDCSTWEGRLLAEFLAARVALVAAHTNLDAADAGINARLAETFGLQRPAVLQPTRTEGLQKLAVFVPRDHVEKVRAAMCDAGAGVIGEYRDCSFRSPGAGTFRGSDASTPFIGQRGRLEEADEFRLEVILPRSLSGAVLAAMKRAHPYEEAAYDLYPLDNPGRVRGFGMVGDLPAPLPAEEMIYLIKTRLSAGAARVAGDTARTVKRMALFSGAGAGAIESAARAGADLFLTADLRYHDGQMAERLGIILVDPGHWETEQVILPDLVTFLAARLPGLPVTRAERRQNPFNTW